MTQKFSQPLFIILFLFFIFSAASCSDDENNGIAPESYTDTALKEEIHGDHSFYTYEYPSIDADGNPITLSAAIIAWRPTKNIADSQIESVVVLSHMTIFSNFECPTMYPSIRPDTDVMLLWEVVGRTGYKPLSHSIVIMPDYEGYGATVTRQHPYLARELTARQVVDAMRYGLKYYQQLVEYGTNPPLKDNYNTFLTGFSQGAAVSLGTQQYIEENGLSDEFHLKGSLIGDGPYDMLSTLHYYINDNGTSYGVNTIHRQNEVSMPMAMALAIKGMIRSHPDMRNYHLTDFFTKSFIDTGIFQWIDDKVLAVEEQKNTPLIWHMLYDEAEYGHTAADGTVYSSEEMQQLISTHFINDRLIFNDQYHAHGNLQKMLVPEVYEYLASLTPSSPVPTDKGNPAHDLHRALYDNVIGRGWTPQHRIIFMHSKHDIVVPFCNYLSFAEAHPNADIRLEVFSKEDHVDAGKEYFIYLYTNGSTLFDWLAGK